MEIVILLAVLMIFGGSVYLYLMKNSDKVNLPKKEKKTSTELELHTPEIIEADIVSQRPQHVIVRTWIGGSNIGMDTFHWKCSCGAKGNSFFEELASNDASTHATKRNRELKMLEETNGQFGW